MEWVLIIVMALPGQPAEPPLRAGLMRDEAICGVAGAGMALLLARANPGVVVGWRCEPAAEAGA